MMSGKTKAVHRCANLHDIHTTNAHLSAIHMRIIIHLQVDLLTASILYSS